MKKFLALFTVFSLLIPGMAMASVMRADSNVNADENLQENVYITGGNPVIAGTVQGDLMASGGNVFVSGHVFQDALIAGGTVNVTGQVEGDLRVFAGNVMVDGPVSGELMVFAGSVVVGPHAVIRGDVNVMSGRVQIDPNAKMLSKHVSITNGDAADQKAPRPVFDTNRFLTLAFWGAQLLLLLGIFVVVAVLHLLFPNFTKKLVTGGAYTKFFGRSFLTGLVLFVTMPFVALICLITGVGGFLGALILIAYAGCIMASMLYSGVIFGGLLYELIKKPKKYALGWGWLILGIVGLHVVTLLPFIGWLIGFVFFLTAWGALVSLKWQQMKSM